MNELTHLLAVGVIHLLAVMSPGPDVLLMIRNSLAGRRRAGLQTAAGILAGNVVQVGALVLGASLLFAPGSRALFALKLVGAAYLIYLGSRILLARPAPTETAPEPRAGGSYFLQGFLTNLTNAKAWIYWFSIASQFISASPIPALSVLVGINGVWFASIALFVGREAVHTRLSASSNLVERGMGLLLLGYGVAVLITAY